MKHSKLYLTLGFVAVLSSGCGGGGGGGGSSSGPTYNGLTAPVAITSTNSEALSTSATGATENAITQQNASDASIFKVNGESISNSNTKLSERIVNITRQIVSQIQPTNSLPVGTTLTATDLGAPFCGGSVTFPDNFGSSTLNGTITYNSLCYSDSYSGQVTMDGSVIFTETATEISIRYVNFTVTSSADTSTMNMTITCDINYISCSISSDFEGSDGKTYRVADLSISGSGTGPYTINATFYHPDYGSVTIAGSGLYYNCTNGYPSAGTITITGANGSSASITFTTCSDYSGTWNDGSSSGSFSGTWL